MKAVNLYIESEPNVYSVCLYKNMSIVQEIQRAARKFGKRCFYIPCA
jgi:hypothetical protein